MLNKARNLIKLISPERASNNYDWRLIGECLFNIDSTLLPEWIEFSQYQNDSSECKKVWSEMKISTYNLDTLELIAQKGNPDGYQLYRDSILNLLVNESLDNTYFSIAKLLTEICQYFKYTTNKQWYKFETHRWIKTDINEIYYIIREKLVPMFQKLQNVFHKSYSINKNSTDLEKITQTQTIISQLCLVAYCRNVIKEYIDLVYDPDFHKQVDKKKYLICFNNGVYDMKSNIFRDGYPGDCITLCTGYDYLNWDPNNKYNKVITDFFEQIQPDQSAREKLLNTLSNCLIGSDPGDELEAFIGSGSNGKSTLMDLVSVTFGELFFHIDLEQMLSCSVTKHSNNFDLYNKIHHIFSRINHQGRICFLGEKIKSDWTDISILMKYFNQMYGKTNLQFKPFIVSNYEPKFEYSSVTHDKIKTISFTSVFVDTVKNKNQYLRDPYFREINLEWKETFMSMLIQHYKMKNYP